MASSVQIKVLLRETGREEGNIICMEFKKDSTQRLGSIAFFDSLEVAEHVQNMLMWEGVEVLPIHVSEE